MQIGKSKKVLNNLVVISDIHAGCGYGLAPLEFKMDSGGIIKASRMQEKMFGWWEYFWQVWVPMVTKGEKYGIMINGDLVDGRHHNAISQMVQNKADQMKVALELLSPIREKTDHFYVVRGTEAHGGLSGEDEEKLAQTLEATKNEDGLSARYDLWIKIGKGLVHALHHIGTTSSMAYETSALMGEWTASQAEAARWGYVSPDIVVRSHRHRHAAIQIPTKRGNGICFVSAGWQLKTPFVYKIAGGRQSPPQMGGSVIRFGDEELFARHWTQSILPSRTETPEV